MKNRMFNKKSEKKKFKNIKFNFQSIGGTSTLDALDASRPSPSLTPDIYVTPDNDCGDPVGGNVSFI